MSSEASTAKLSLLWLLSFSLATGEEIPEKSQYYLQNMPSLFCITMHLLIVELIICTYFPCQISLFGISKFYTWEYVMYHQLLVLNCSLVSIISRFWNVSLKISTKYWYFNTLELIIHQFYDSVIVFLLLQGMSLLLKGIWYKYVSHYLCYICPDQYIMNEF